MLGLFGGSQVLLPEIEAGGVALGQQRRDQVQFQGHRKRLAILQRTCRGGHVRRVIQVLGVTLMVAGFLVDSSLRRRNRRAGRTSEEPGTSRLPQLLFWIGAVLLVLGSI